METSRIEVPASRGDEMRCLIMDMTAECNAMQRRVKCIYGQTFKQENIKINKCPALQ